MHSAPWIHLQAWVRRARILALGLAAWCRRATAAGPQADMLELDLPAGPLSATLLGIGHSADMLVSFNPGLVAPHQAPALRGRFTLQQALALALGSSDLGFRITPSGVVTVVVRSDGKP